MVSETDDILSFFSNKIKAMIIIIFVIPFPGIYCFPIRIYHFQITDLAEVCIVTFPVIDLYEAANKFIMQYFGYSK